MNAVPAMPRPSHDYEIVPQSEQGGGGHDDEDMIEGANDNAGGISTTAGDVPSPPTPVLRWSRHDKSPATRAALTPRVTARRIGAAFLATVALSGLVRPWRRRDASPVDVLGLNRAHVVRQELRTLSVAQLDQVVDAMWTIRQVPGPEGRRRFGPGYVSYDEFVERHWVDVLHLRCGNQSLHEGVLFGVYHLY